MNYRTCDYTLIPSDNGAIFTNEGATEPVTFTVSSELTEVTFLNTADKPMRVRLPSGKIKKVKHFFIYREFDCINK